MKKKKKEEKEDKNYWLPICMCIGKRIKKTINNGKDKI